MMIRMIIMSKYAKSWTSAGPVSWNLIYTQISETRRTQKKSSWKALGKSWAPQN